MIVDDDRMLWRRPSSPIGHAIANAVTRYLLARDDAVEWWLNVWAKNLGMTHQDFAERHSLNCESAEGEFRLYDAHGEELAYFRPVGGDFFQCALPEGVRRLRMGIATSIAKRQKMDPSDVVQPSGRLRFHRLKIWEEFYKPVFEGKKTFEVCKRNNDRNFRVGDLLILREWARPDIAGILETPARGPAEFIRPRFTGRKLVVLVTFLENVGLKWESGPMAWHPMAVMSIKVLQQHERLRHYRDYRGAWEP